MGCVGGKNRGDMDSGTRLVCVGSGEDGGGGFGYKNLTPHHHSSIITHGVNLKESRPGKEAGDFPTALI